MPTGRCSVRWGVLYAGDSGPWLVVLCRCRKMLRWVGVPFCSFELLLSFLFVLLCHQHQLEKDPEFLLDDADRTMLVSCRVLLAGFLAFWRSFWHWCSGTFACETLGCLYLIDSGCNLLGLQCPPWFFIRSSFGLLPTPQECSSRTLLS